MNERSLLLAATVLAVVPMLTGCHGGKPEKAGDAAKAGEQDKPGKQPAGPSGAKAMRRAPVEVQPVTRQRVEYKIQTVGELQPDEVVRIPARVSGVVENITFREGTQVAKGATLAHIDSERYRLQAERSEAAARQAEAQLKETEAALAKRKALRDRDPGWVSEEELSNFGARVEQGRAALAAARAAQALAQKDLADSAVRAEVPGVIDSKLVDTGQFVSPGTPVATMVDTRKLKLQFKVTETESARLAGAKEVRFRVRSLPGREFQARIYHVSDAANPATRMVPCLAWVDLSVAAGGNAELRPGTFADVTVVVDTRDSVVVPTSATLPSESGFIAWVMVSDEAAERRQLELGLNTREGEVEVLHGLEPGDRLVVRGGAALKPGMKLQIAAADAAADAGAAKPEAGAKGATR